MTRSAVLLLGALAFAAGCRESTAVKVSTALDEAQTRWQAAAIRDYDYILSISCFCAPSVRPVKITVAGGAPVSVVYADSIGGVADTAFFRGYLTIDQIFATLQTRLASAPATFDAQYDAALGYPKLVSIDPNTAIADDEIGISVTTLNNPTTP